RNTAIHGKKWSRPVLRRERLPGECGAAWRGSHGWRSFWLHANADRDAADPRRTVFPRSADFQHAPSVYHSIAASGGAGPATSQRPLRRGSSLLRLGIRDFFYVTAAGRAAQELDGDRNRGSWSP